MLAIIPAPAAGHSSPKRKVTCLTCKLKGCVGKCRFQSMDSPSYHAGLRATTDCSPPEPLIQIRHVYAADYRGFLLSVGVDSDGWAARVRKDGQSLYSARRCSLAAAKAAAAEFTLVAGGADRRYEPDALARDLAWHESW